jgi:hypothetical protein
VALPLALQLVARHGIPPGGVGFHIALMGFIGILFFGRHALRNEAPAESRRIGYVGVAICALVVGGGTWLFVEQNGVGFATHAFLTAGVLVAGIFGSFFLMLTVGMGGREVAGYVLGLVGLGVTCVLAWYASQL